MPTDPIDTLRLPDDPLDPSPDFATTCGHASSAPSASPPQRKPHKQLNQLKPNKQLKEPPCRRP